MQHEYLDVVLMIFNAMTEKFEEENNRIPYHIKRLKIRLEQVHEVLITHREGFFGYPFEVHLFDAMYVIKVLSHYIEQIEHQLHNDNMNAWEFLDLNKNCEVLRDTREYWTRLSTGLQN